MASIWSWSPWHRYSQWSASRHGRLDGAAGIPETEEKLNPPYVMELKNVGEELIAEAASSWEMRDARLLAEFCIGSRERERIEESLEESRRSVAESEKAALEARKEYSQHFHIPEWFYIAIMLAIASGEFPLNSIVFQLFGDAKLVTYCASMALGVSLPVLAHCLGGGLREGFFKDGKFSARTGLFVTSVVATVGVLLGIAYFREKYFEGSGVQQLMGLQMDVTTVTVAFVFINLFLVTIATLVAYFEHNPDAKIQRHLYRDARSRARRAKRSVRKFELLRARNDKRVAESAALRERSFRAAVHDIKQLRDWTQRLMSVYRSSNLRTRDGSTMPASFKRFPDIDVPKEFVPDGATLSWECGGMATPALPPPKATMSAETVVPGEAQRV